MSAIPAGGNIAGAVLCYTCHEPGPDAGGEPLRRDCACRGEDAGFAHLSCLAVYATNMSRDAETLSGFVRAWKRCSICTGCFRNEFAREMATEFGEFVEREYPGDTLNDTRRRILALGVGLSALEWLPRRLTCVRGDNIVILANQIIRAMNYARGEGFRVGDYVTKIEAQAYGMLGRVSLCGVTPGYAMRAAEHFENQLRISEAVNDDLGVRRAQDNILVALSDGDCNGFTNAGWVRISQRLYELRVIRSGVGSRRTIHAGIFHANRLRLANRREEGHDLLIELRATCRLRLGRAHRITVEIERLLFFHRGRR